MNDLNGAATQPVDRLIYWPEVANIVPLSRVSVWKLRQSGDFPRPVKLTANRIAWRLSEVMEWVRTREAA
mgnify:CR=1 FL=1